MFPVNTAVYYLIVGAAFGLGACFAAPIGYKAGVKTLEGVNNLGEAIGNLSRKLLTSKKEVAEPVPA